MAKTVKQIEALKNRLARAEGDCQRAYEEYARMRHSHQLAATEIHQDGQTKANKARLSKYSAAKVKRLEEKWLKKVEAAAKIRRQLG